MPLHLRKRGDTWHARGTVRVGRETLHVAEFSTGCRARADAEEVAGREEARIRAEALEGPAGRAKRVTIAEAILVYLHRPGGVPAYDATRLGDLSDRIGNRPIADAPAAWQDWMRQRAAGWAPATVARSRAIYVAALRHGCEALGLPAPKIPTVRERQIERTAHLHADERQRLLAAYNRHAACPALLLAYAGLRSQEALQLDWIEVDFRSRVIHVGRTKSGKVRIVPMHPRVDGLLFGLWHAAGKPTRGPVFISAKGEAYTDTRGDGGNPLSRAHATACRIAGVTGFRPHDWRHDFATRFLAEGGDVRSLMQIMGWNSPRMVARYVTYRVDHLAAVLARVA